MTKLNATSQARILWQKDYTLRLFNQEETQMTIKSLQTIAAEWHQGQNTALYAYASTGTVQAGLRKEIIACFPPAKAKEFIELQRLYVATAPTPRSHEIAVAYEFWHRIARNADGSPVRTRPSGKMKTWKTRPGEFKQPVKYGLKTSLYITHENVTDWVIAP